MEQVRYKGFSRLVLRAFLYIERFSNEIFSYEYNPFYFLGAISIFFLWLLLGTGIYLFIFYKMSPEKAYDSVQYLSVNQWYLGGVMRSIHRYASDGLVISMTIHTLQVFFKDKYRRFRWLAWVSGVGLIIFVLFEGVSGYWLVWDHLAQTIAVYIAELLDFIPIFGEPLTRAFSTNHSVTGLFFFLMLGMHSAIPIFGLILILLHIARLSHAKINPPRLLNIALVVSLLFLSIVKPAMSGPRADLLRLPASIGVDWFYLFYLPILKVLPVWQSWVLTVGVFTLFTLVPWISREKKLPVAQVSLKECTGCAQCFEDCPYEAIVMQPRTEYATCPYCGKERDKEAVILPNKCSSCTTCIGACDYRAMSLGVWNYNSMKDMITELISKGKGAGKPLILGFVCSHGVSLEGIHNPETGALKDMPNVRVIVVPCTGIINPNILSFSIRSGADGVFISGCPINDCHYRLGNSWLIERLRGDRKPTFKISIESKLRAYWLSAVQTDELLKELAIFEEDLKEERSVGIFQERHFRWAYSIPALVILLIPTMLIFYLSNASYSFYKDKVSQLKLTFRHTTKLLEDCGGAEKLKEEMERYEEILKKTGRVPMHQVRLECNRERHPAMVELYVDGEKLLSKSFKPRGLRKDGPVYVYNRFTVSSGRHTLEIRMRDSGKKKGYDYILKKDVDFKEGMVVLVDFDDLKKTFVISAG